MGGTGQGGQVTDADRAPQRKALQERARAVTAGVDALTTLLVRHYASAARSLFKAEGQARYDAEAYRQWLVAERFAADDAAARTLEATRLAVTAGGHLEPEVWEREVLRPALAQLEALARDDASPRLLCAVDPRAQRATAELLGQALALLQRWTRALYAKAKLTPPAADARGVQPAATRATRGELEGTRRLLLQLVGAQAP